MNKNFLIVSCSQRYNSNSLKISQYINNEFFDNEATIYDLQNKPLPFWGEPEDLAVNNAQNICNNSTGIVFVVPEWNGMAPAAIKNFFLWMSAKQLAHKPALLISISAGDGGAFVISELRSSSYKNCRINYIPEHVILRQANDFIEDKKNTERYLYYRSRLNYAISTLKVYSESYVLMKDKLNNLPQKFANGMS